MKTLVSELKERVDHIVQGGGTKAIERHKSKGKITF